jgi:FkbM family methyltransferase
MLYKGMSRGEIEKAGYMHASGTEVANVLNTFKLYVDPNEVSVAVHLSKSGYWEAWITKWFIDNIQPGFTCVDVGANFGYFTRLLEWLVGPDGKVYAIEANPALYESLKKSIEDFPMKNGSDVVLSNVALADEVGMAELGVLGNNFGGASILYGGVHGLPITNTYTVMKTTLDKIVEKDEYIDFVKLDIEGAEPLAMKGMEGMMDRIGLIVLEVLPSMAQYNPRFLHELFYKYTVTKINFLGVEEPITYEQVANSDDLSMLVLRK